MPVEKTSKRGTIHKMNYVNFDDAITAKFGIVREAWPPGVPFQSPSAMTHLEAEICLHAFQNNAARFRSLTDEEWREWLKARYTPKALEEPAAAEGDPADSAAQASGVIETAKTAETPTAATPAESSTTSETTWRERRPHGPHGRAHGYDCAVSACRRQAPG